MPELKYTITADDSKFRKTLQDASKEADKNNAKLARQVNTALEGEATNRGKVIERIKQQQRSVQSLQIQLQSYQAIANQATDPARLTEYNRKVQGLQAEIARLSNAGKKGFDEMGNAIQKSGNVFTKVWGGLRKAAYLIPGFGIAGLLALAIDPLTKLVQGMEIFSGKLTKAKIEAGAVGKAFKSPDYVSAVSSIEELGAKLDLARKGALDKTEVIKEYNKALGNSTTEATSLAEVEKGLADNAEGYIKMTLAKAAASEALAEAVSREVEKEELQIAKAEDLATAWDKAWTVIKNRLKGGSVIDPLSQADAIGSDIIEKGEDRRAKKLEKNEGDRLKFLDIYKKKLEEAQEAADSIGFKITDPDVNRKTLSAYDTLLSKISDLQDEYTRKSLSSNEAEIQAVRDKFKKVATEIAKFNDDPKNKIKIDTSELDTIRDRAISDLTYRQETEALKLELSNQKKLYEDFEAWRDKAGRDAATDRYKGLIETDKTYLEVLQDEINKLESKGSLTGAEEGRLKYLKDVAEKEFDIHRKNQDKLLLGLLSFNQQRRALEEKHNRERKKLGETATKEQLQQLEIFYDKSLKMLQNSFKYVADAHLLKINTSEDLEKEVAELSKYRINKETELQKKLLGIAKKAAKDRIAVLKKEQEDLGVDNAADIQKEENFIIKSDQYLSRLKDNYIIIGETLASILAQSSTDFVAKIGNVIQQMSAGVGQIKSSDSTLGKAQGLIGIITGLGATLKSVKADRDNKEIDALRAITREVSNRISFEAEINRLYSERRKIENDSIFFGPDQGQVIRDSAKDLEDANKTLTDSITALMNNGVFSAEGTGKRNLFGSKTETSHFSLKEIFAGILPDSDTTADWLQGWFTSGWSQAIKSKNWQDVAGAILDPLQIFSGHSASTRANKDAFKNLTNGVNEALGAMGKSVEDFSSFSNQELLTFFTLMEKGGYILDEATKQIIETSKAAAAAALEAEKAMNEAVKSMVGMLGNDLKNAMVAAFKAGEDASKVFGDTVKGVIDDIIADMLFKALFEDDLEKLKEDIKAAYLAGNNISTVIQQFKKDTQGKAAQYERDLGASGINRDPTDRQPGALAGAIKGITADQADLLAGQFAGMRLAQLETVELARTRNSTLAMHSSFMTQQLNYLNSISMNTGVTAQNTGELKRMESMEKSLKSMDRKMGSTTNQMEAAGQ